MDGIPGIHGVTGVPGIHGVTGTVNEDFSVP
jgi:hypothetical protein